ncbi:hypothetical protein ACHAWC_008024 [Mediolabrus comicus]
MRFDPSTLTRIRLDAIRALKQCEFYGKNTQFAWANLSNDEMNEVYDEVEETMASMDRLDREKLAHYFNNLVINQSHYRSKKSQKELLRNSLLLICSFDYNDLAKCEAFNDSSSTTVDSQSPTTTHMAHNSDAENVVRSELFKLGGREMDSDETLKGSNILFKHEQGSVYFIHHMSVEIAYVILHYEFTFLIENNGHFLKGGKATAEQVLKRGTVKKTYHPSVYCHERRRISPVCSYNDKCNGMLEALAILLKHLYASTNEKQEYNTSGKDPPNCATPTSLRRPCCIYSSRSKITINEGWNEYEIAKLVHRLDQSSEVERATRRLQTIRTRPNLTTSQRAAIDNALAETASPDSSSRTRRSSGATSSTSGSRRSSRGTSSTSGSRRSSRATSSTSGARRSNNRSSSSSPSLFAPRGNADYSENALRNFEARHKKRDRCLSEKELFTYSTILETDLCPESKRLVNYITSQDASFLIIALGYSTDPIQSLVDVLDDDIPDDEPRFTTEHFKPGSIFYRILCELYVHIMLQVQPNGIHNTFYHYLLLAMIAYVVDNNSTGPNVILCPSHGKDLAIWNLHAVRHRCTTRQIKGTTTQYGIEIDDFDENALERKILDEYGLTGHGNHEEAITHATIVKSTDNATKSRQDEISKKRKRPLANRAQDDAMLDELLAEAETHHA